MAEEKDYAALLKQGFDRVLTAKYGSAIPPPPYVTPFGVRHLDTLLGGGLTSSSPIAFSSTPETGKSTIALQFCSMFQNHHKNSVVVYLDTESAAGGECPEIEDRIQCFGINKDRFLYKPIVTDLQKTFELLKELIDMKQEMYEKRKIEVNVLFVLDSIAATGSSKDETAESADKVIGFKARELTQLMNKHKQHISMQRVSFIVIDQVRANMQIQSRFQAATEERGVGTFGNYKSATNVNSLQHQFRQWLWLSKGTQLKPTQDFGVDGWIMNVFTEKNKLAPSKYSVPLVFDKKYGIIPVLSEYIFLNEKTKTENKLWPKDKKMPYPLAISGGGEKSKGSVLTVVKPDTGEVIYTSPKFTKSKFLNFYNTDPTFRQMFNLAVDYSCEQRIKNNLFREDPNSVGVEVEDTESSGSFDELDEDFPTPTIQLPPIMQQSDDEGDPYELGE